MPRCHSCSFRRMGAPSSSPRRRSSSIGRHRHFRLTLDRHKPPRTRAAAAAGERRRSLLRCPAKLYKSLRRAPHSPTLSRASLAAPPSSSLLCLGSLGRADVICSVRYMPNENGRVGKGWFGK
ncbi:hypothetical protein Scep_016811 [Stephania cephalantha]|uniref:Uncharacterized protein n=1 Tax=Stephania cephalantha TaxID=152367 RepID=A0AAP0NTN6_9MAGN